TLRFENKVFENEFTAKAIRQAVTSPDGKTLVFNAAGEIYKKNLATGKVESMFPPDVYLSGNKASKSGQELSPDGKTLIFYDEYGPISKKDLATGRLESVPRPFPYAHFLSGTDLEFEPAFAP